VVAISQQLVPNDVVAMSLLFSHFGIRHTVLDEKGQEVEGGFGVVGWKVKNISTFFSRPTSAGSGQRRG
jgi:hypothetical protein